MYARCIQGSGPKRRDAGKRRDEEHVGTISVQAHPDPYMFRRALKSEEELADLRHKKSGKRLVSFHRKQNAVSRLSYITTRTGLTRLSLAPNFTAQDDGRAHGRGKGGGGNRQASGRHCSAPR